MAFTKEGVNVYLLSFYYSSQASVWFSCAYLIAVGLSEKPYLVSSWSPLTTGSFLSRILLSSIRLICVGLGEQLSDTFLQ